MSGCLKPRQGPTFHRIVGARLPASERLSPHELERSAQCRGGLGPYHLLHCHLTTCFLEAVGRTEIAPAELATPLSDSADADPTAAAAASRVSANSANVASVGEVASVVVEGLAALAASPKAALIRSRSPNLAMVRAHIFEGVCAVPPDPEESIAGRAAPVEDVGLVEAEADNESPWLVDVVDGEIGWHEESMLALMVARVRVAACRDEPAAQRHHYRRWQRQEQT
mmetsp:Transcript_7598/g.23692  ORF Transcript_7598/g.23692 Transcript_7598/m.23692 type:complete len:226 (-) Transcript_7598:2189-2866(-)|eukprot:scaffold49653_cov31-Tisochrysis_lutea.AAC.5